MDNKNLPLREEDENLLNTIYETMTEDGRNVLLDKYKASGQGQLKGKTEAYHFQSYKNEHFTGAQLKKLDKLLTKIIKPREKLQEEYKKESGLGLIGRLPTEKSTGINRAKYIFECFAEAKGISQPECLLEFLELCADKHFPLVAFENDTEGLKNTIEDLRKYIANRKGQADVEKTVVDKDQNNNAAKVVSNNIKPIIGKEKWLDPFNHKALRLVGRKKEFELLDKFIQESGQFKIWAIVGPSGAGKTRLFSEWAFNSPALESWDCRVLHKEDRTEPEKWSNWIPDKPTLLIIDYMYGFEAVIQKLMHHRLEPDIPKIRLLLIDHVFSEPLHSDKRWGFSGDGSSLNRNEKYFFDTKPLDLRKTKNQKEIIKSIIARRAKINKKSNQVNAAHDFLQNMQGAYHPLFAALVGDAIIKSGNDFKVWNRRELIDYYLSGDDRLPWKRGDDIGRWASYFIAVATIRRGMNYCDLIEAAGNCISSPALFEDVKLICQKVISDNDAIILSPFEPDILGESFFLKFLQFLENSPKYQNEFRQILMAGNENTQTEDAIEFIAFIQRLTRNLLNDDQSLKETLELWNSLFNFMDPSDFEAAEPIRWAVTAGLVFISFTLKDQFPEEIDALLKKIDPTSFYHFNKENLLIVSVWYSMAYFELINKSLEIAPQFSQEMIELLDRYTTANNNYEDSPLINACEFGFNKSIHALISHGMTTGAKYVNGHKALMAASFMGKIETVRYLLNTINIDIDTRDTMGRTVLSWACICEDVKAVRLLLDEGASIDAMDYGTRTALILAISYNHVDIVGILLERGADPYIYDENGRNALMYASINGYIDIVNLLLEKKVVDMEDIDGNSSLKWAITKNHIEIVNLLIDKIENINTDRNRIALTHASRCRHIEMVRLLLEKGADTEITDESGCTAFLIACSVGCVKTIRLLIDSVVTSSF